MPILLWPSWLDWWTEEENQRLLITVGVSLFLHYATLALWKSPVASGSVSTSAVTVFLAARPNSQAASVAPTEVLVPELSTPRLPPLPPVPPVTPAPTPVAEIVKPLPPTPSLPQRMASTTSKVSSAATGQASPPPAPQALTAQHADGVTVVLRVNADGKVTQIFWNRLPAISVEQLDRLEHIVRTRQFVPHVTDRTVSEIIDVRALLRLPPAQSADSAPINSVPSAVHFQPDGLPVSPAPTGE